MHVPAHHGPGKPLDTLPTALYVLVDDHVIELGPRRPGTPKRLSDADSWCVWRWRRCWSGPVGASLAADVLRAAGHLFPYLPKQPEYHKRVKAAAPLICRATLHLATLCPSWPGVDDHRIAQG